MVRRKEREFTTGPMESATREIGWLIKCKAKVKSCGLVY